MVYGTPGVCQRARRVTEEVRGVRVIKPKAGTAAYWVLHTQSHLVLAIAISTIGWAVLMKGISTNAEPRPLVTTSASLRVEMSCHTFIDSQMHRERYTDRVTLRCPCTD